MSLHDKGRIVKTTKNYYFDRRLFRIYLTIIIFSCVIGLITLGVTKGAYVNCPQDAIGGKCFNPLYNNCDLPACKKEFLNAGESIGEQPPEIIDGLYIMSIVLLGITLLINHLFQEQNKRLYDEQTKQHKNNGKESESKKTITRKTRTRKHSTKKHC